MNKDRPTYILIQEGNELAGIYHPTLMQSVIIKKIDNELENRYQSVKAELETYEEFMSLPPHQLL